jgi:flagellar P-ring protein FlgI
MKSAKCEVRNPKFRMNFIGLILLTSAILLLTSNFVLAASAPVRLKDIAHVLEVRDNQLMGFGLVAGLKNTGDTIQTQFTKQAMTNMLSRMGIAPMDKDFRSRNIAAVMVTAKLPAFVRSGQKIDVVVSSVGDATSLYGGTLLMTPLQGADDNVYAVAQGPLSFGIIDSIITPSDLDKKQSNAGRIPNGGIVEKEVPVSINQNYVTIVIDRPDFTTASRISAALKDLGISARARDAATIVASREAGMQYVDFVSKVENLSIVPDTVAKITINEQTGVVIMGENVTVAPFAVTNANISVTVVSETTLSQLVRTLNSIGVKPQDLIGILQAARAAGAISADIEVD